MTREKQTKRTLETHIRDTRGQKVTQLDPVDMRLLRRHDVIDADALRAIAADVGTGLEERTRKFIPLFVIFGVVVAIALIAQVIDYAIQGDLWGIFKARNIALFNIWFLPFVIWTQAKRARFGRIRKVMLKHSRCPHCGYDLQGLAPDEADSCTVCPECGCAWRMPERET